MAKIESELEQNQETFRRLKFINQLFKNQCYEEGKGLLERMQNKVLHPGLQMYTLYLQALYSQSNFTRSLNVKSLLDANQFLSELIRVAHDHCIRPKDPNYLFTRAHVKFLLSKEHGNAEDRLRDRNQALKLTETGMQLYPDMECFTWLNDQIAQIHD